MIPRLPLLAAPAAPYAELLSALAAGGFTGDLETGDAQRLAMATDNSVYQTLPEAVVFPRGHDDVVLLLRLLAEPRFRQVVVAPRGGGTGTNGQSLTSGLVIDVSRHMAAILELNVEEGWVRVQPGLVLDELNATLRRHGMLFGPSVSPGNRATLGGMISTDASGEGSRVYGKTSQSVLALAMVLPGGASFTSARLDPAGLAAIKERDDQVGRLHQLVDEVVSSKAELIRSTFPKLQRFMTGYNLAMVRDGDSFDLNYLLCGAEGTLGVVSEAKLRIRPLPGHKRMVVLKFATFDDALASAEQVIGSDPSAIETIDGTVLDLARHDVIWHKVGDLLDDAAGAPITRAVNLVEYLGDDAGSVDGRAAALCRDVDARRGQPGQPLGYHVARTPAEAEAMWTLRKKGVGLLGNAPGARKPIPFVEDTVVPPERLRAYIQEFRALLDAEGLRYGMFGHIDVGCLHVRPALDMKDPDDERLLRRISDRVVELVQRHGGVIWGEHGKGLRSEYNPRFFGEELFGDLCRIKGAFDPGNQLNPGKIAFPPGNGALTSIDAPKRGAWDRQIPVPVRQKYAVAIDCNGNGQCFDWDPDRVMCPSSKATRDRIHSPKGRAGVMREWLRRLAEARFDPLDERRDWSWGARFWNRWRRAPDYSHEVYDAMAGCLACKACATQCPIKVDVPSFRAEFLELYHTRYARPLRDHLVAGLEGMLPLLARIPRLANGLMGWPPVRWLLAHVAGIVDSPSLSVPPARRALPAPASRGAVSGERGVLLLPDAFTTFYEAPVLVATVELLRALGLEVEVLPYRPSGKALHIRGFVRRFDRVAREHADHLRAAAARGYPIVGIDPAVVLMHRDEVPRALKGDPGYRVHLLQEWLLTRPDLLRPLSAAPGSYTLLAHCTERTAEPGAPAAWKKVFEAFGLTLDVPELGCCGMCGVFGHEREHRDESEGIFRAGWARHLPAEPAARERFVADGHSCRSQCERFAGFLPRHPVQVLAELAARGPALGHAPG